MCVGTVDGLVGWEVRAKRLKNIFVCILQLSIYVCNTSLHEIYLTAFEHKLCACVRIRCFQFAF